MVPADGAVVYDDIPSPQSDGIPLLGINSLGSATILQTGSPKS